ncbi:MAG: hypothetical protein R3308_00700 [Thiohalobacterales bacterium]|nr:hypothetical protein [Thiohalobacterales bacterium]
MRKLLIINALIAINQAAMADDRDKTMFAAQASPQWQQTSAHMLVTDYQHRTGNNMLVLRQGLSEWSGRIRDSGGAYVPVASAVGAAISLAASDRRYSLNDSKTMGLVLRDSTSSDRSLMLEYRRSIW